MSNIGESQNDVNVLTLLGEIKSDVRGLRTDVSETRSDMKDVKDRMARLEEGTSRAIPLVDEIDHQVQGHEHRITNLERFRDGHCQEHTITKATAGNRWWDAFKAFLGPLAAVIVTWLLATKGGSK